MRILFRTQRMIRPLKSVFSGSIVRAQARGEGTVNGARILALNLHPAKCHCVSVQSVDVSTLKMSGPVSYLLLLL